jgi:hypothetical protein
VRSGRGSRTGKSRYLRAAFNLGIKRGYLNFASFTFASRTTLKNSLFP